MHPLHLELLRWDFPNRSFTLKSNLLEEALVLLKQSHSLCLQLLMDKKTELCCFPSIWETEKLPLLSPPGKGHQPHTTSTPWPSIPPPGPESGRLFWLSAGHSDVPGMICIGGDWGR